MPMATLPEIVVCTLSTTLTRASIFCILITSPEWNINYSREAESPLNHISAKLYYIDALLFSPVDGWITPILHTASLWSSQWMSKWLSVTQHISTSDNTGVEQSDYIYIDVSACGVISRPVFLPWISHEFRCLTNHSSRCTTLLLSGHTLLRTRFIYSLTSVDFACVCSLVQFFCSLVAHARSLHPPLVLIKT